MYWMRIPNFCAEVYPNRENIWCTVSFEVVSSRCLHSCVTWRFSFHVWSLKVLPLSFFFFYLAARCWGFVSPSILLVLLCMIWAFSSYCKFCKCILLLYLASYISFHTLSSFFIFFLLYSCLPVKRSEVFLPWSCASAPHWNDAPWLFQTSSFWG